jgi:hypothetical protein
MWYPAPSLLSTLLILKVKDKYGGGYESLTVFDGLFVRVGYFARYTYEPVNSWIPGGDHVTAYELALSDLMTDDKNCLYVGYVKKSTVQSFENVLSRKRGSELKNAGIEEGSVPFSYEKYSRHKRVAYDALFVYGKKADLVSASAISYERKVELIMEYFDLTKVERIPAQYNGEDIYIDYYYGACKK